MKKKVMVTNAGRGTAINYCRSLRLANEDIEIIGIDNNKFSIFNAEADKKILCPDADSEDYLPFLKDQIEKTGANFLYPSKTNDELFIISEHREELEKMGVKIYLPRKEDIEIYENKFSTFEILSREGISVPETMLLNDENDLKKALELFPDGIWLRAI